MQSDQGSQLSSQNSGIFAPLSAPPVDENFTLTKDDTRILEEYIDQFQDGDAEARTRIVANAMAELAVLRPDGVLFDKVLASRVRSCIITQTFIQLSYILENSQVVL
jgi:hypothetical protein